MCKVAGVNGVNDENREAVWEFMQELGSRISVGNPHGLGYSAVDKNGDIFGEKWLHNADAFRDPSNMRNLNFYGTKVKDSYSFFGKKVKRDEARSIILHTRAATCDINIDNVHPFYDNKEDPEVVLIHNGAITNDDTLTKIHSTCDSEVIVHEYLKENCVKDLNNIQKVADSIHGWYTCLVLAKDENGKPFMDIFSENGRLATYFVKELNCRIYSSVAHDIKETCEFFGYSYTDGFKFLSDSMRRLDIDNGDILFKGTFQSMRPEQEARMLEYWDQMFAEMEKENKSKKPE